MSDLIDRQTVMDVLIERDPSGLDSVLNIIRGLPDAQPEVTEEDVIEYCRKRCLCIVDSALFKKTMNLHRLLPIRSQRLTKCRR